ncbi:MAG: SDR family oxidoreductase [Actinobacteria bacterium]|nr:SDR family oxidoreductase [Actinomycetota bacterium]
MGAEFEGRRAVVTGAASGIGLATALALLAQGATVLAADRDGDRLAAAAAAGAEPLACDLSDAAERDRLLAAAGDCDFLVNSAGIIRLRPIGELGEDDWEAIFAINAKATFFLCQRLGPRLPAGGAIVNISSMSARNAVNTETAAYAATKAAVLSITRSFAHALAAREVRVNAVVPGLIDTPMQDKVVADISTARNVVERDLGAAREAAVPIGRLGSAAECAEAILWLLSPASSYLTGQAIAVDGGATML